MNILLINHYAGSPRHGMEFRPYYMAREWLKNGHKVQVVAASHSHVRAKQPDLGKCKSLDEIVDGVPYRWYAVAKYTGNGVRRVRNIIAFLLALWRDADRLVREFAPDLVIASSTYPMDIWPAKRIANLAKAKLVYEVHDLWPLSPMELGGMSKWHPFILWVQAAEDYAYRLSDAVVSMLPKTKEYMMSRGMRSEKFHYVPNGVDCGEWEELAPLPEETARALTKIRSKGLPVVGYAGTFGLANALDHLLDAAKLAPDAFSVVLVGVGPELEHLKRRIQAEALTNVTLLSAIAKGAIPSFLAAIDIGFIGLLKAPLFRFGISPNKLMDYMMAAKPVVLAVDAGNDPVAEAGCGLTVPAGSPAAIRDAIIDIMSLPAPQRVAMGDNGRKFILENQTYPVLAKSFLQAVGELP